MVNILGINAYHGDSSASLVIDGQLVAAVEEERFTRIKHWAGFPAESIRYCLAVGGIKAQDLDHVAVSYNPKANLNRKLLFTLQQRPSLASLLNRFGKQQKAIGLKDELAAACNCESEDLVAQFHQLEHHTCHFASGFFVSPFTESAILSIDGMGDFVSTLSGYGKANQLQYFERTYYPHSLGFLYNAITLYLGFPNYGDEYKVMGLAPYGAPEYVNQMRQLIKVNGAQVELNLDYFDHHQNGIAMVWDGGLPMVKPFHSKALEDLFGPPRQPHEPLTAHHQNIATSLQVVTEEVIFALLQNLHQRTQSDNLCLVGGCAMNSVANGKITQNTPFKQVYVPVGAADNGTCFGAAFYVWHQILKQPRSLNLALKSDPATKASQPFILEHGYWGSEFTDAECLAAIQEFPITYQQLSDDDLVAQVTDDLCAGLVVGWFQGRMEFGARALGNRSLLADPRREDMRDIINLKIKFREKFRPFAPSILAESVKDYFEIDEPSPFMEKVFTIKPEMQAKIPAVTHVDGTGRLQSVDRHTNPRYWQLIDGFRQKTGIPIVLNTSLNENEPIVRTPAEAISCLLRTKMDALVLNNYYVQRQS